MLPAKRKPLKSGIARAPKREWPRHRKFVRSHGCCVPNCPYQTAPYDAPTEFAHVRSAANSGTGLKPFDWAAVSLCSVHHSWQHQHGAESFQKAFNIDLWAIAAEFTSKSPDLKMKEAMRLAA